VGFYSNIPTGILNIQENSKRLQSMAASIAQNTTGSAYRPVVANTAHSVAQSTPVGKGMNGVANKTASKGQAKTPATAAAANNNASAGIAAVLSNSALANLNPTQQQMLRALLAQANNDQRVFAQLVQKVISFSNFFPISITHSISPVQLTPQTLSALMQQHQQQQSAQQQQAAALQQQQQAAAVAAKTAAAQAAAKAKEVAQSNAQKIASLRQQMKLLHDQQLQQLGPAKAPLSELPFLPNANQPDFCALLGLDLTVQRVLKDKAVFKCVVL